MAEVGVGDLGGVGGNMEGVSLVSATAAEVEVEVEVVLVVVVVVLVVAVVVVVAGVTCVNGSSIVGDVENTGEREGVVELIEGSGCVEVGELRPEAGGVEAGETEAGEFEAGEIGLATGSVEEVVVVVGDVFANTFEEGSGRDVVELNSAPSVLSESSASTSLSFVCGCKSG